MCHVTLSVMDCSRGVGGINESESHGANNCTLRASGTVLLLGCPVLNEGCADTKLLLLRVMALHGLCGWIAHLVDQILSVVGVLYSLLHRHTI